MTPSNKFDLLITSSSWEARCTNILRLTSAYHFRQAYVFWYSGKRPRAAADFEKYHFDILMSALSTVSDHVTGVEAELWEPLEGLSTLCALNRRLLGSDRGFKILIDVSTFTKAFVLVLLRYLDDISSGNRVTLVYTDIAGKQSGRPSEGVKGILALPFYGGTYESNHNNALITFLGFEPDRALALWEYVSPSVTIPLYSIRRDGNNPLKSTLLREQFLCKAGVHDPIQVPGSDPITIAATLARIYAEYKSSYNIVFGAAGSKLQNIGFYLFSKSQRAQVDVFYPIPGRYNLDYWNRTETGPAIEMDLTNGFHVRKLEFEPQLIA